MHMQTRVRKAHTDPGYTRGQSCPGAAQQFATMSPQAVHQSLHLSLVFDCIEDYAPGFKASVIGRDILTPPDLERIFGLPGGVGIMHVNSVHHSGASASGHTALGRLAHTELC